MIAFSTYTRSSKNMILGLCKSLIGVYTLIVALWLAMLVLVFAAPYIGLSGYFIIIDGSSLVSSDLDSCLMLVLRFISYFTTWDCFITLTLTSDFVPYGFSLIIISLPS